MRKDALTDLEKAESRAKKGESQPKNAESQPKKIAKNMITVFPPTHLTPYNEVVILHIRRAKNDL
jgi:hypothetical protein